MEKKCSKCNEVFDAQGNWQKVCKKCYAEQMEAKEKENAGKIKTAGGYTYTPETTDRIIRTASLQEANKTFGEGTKVSPFERLQLAKVYGEFLRTGEVKGLMDEEVVK